MYVPLRGNFGKSTTLVSNLHHHTPPMVPGDLYLPAELRLWPYARGTQALAPISIGCLSRVRVLCGCVVRVFSRCLWLVVWEYCVRYVVVVCLSWQLCLWCLWWQLPVSVVADRYVFRGSCVGRGCCGQGLKVAG